MDKNNIKRIECSLKELYSYLKKNNNPVETIISFLNRFFFFLFLGSKGYIKDGSKYFEKIKKIKKPLELENYFQTIFNELSGKTDKSDLPSVGEPYLTQDKIPYFSHPFIQRLKKTDLFNINLSDLSALEFCNLFESLLITQEKHDNGMYFTSEENIKKVIDPLFLQDLTKEKESLIQLKNRNEKLTEFLEKITSLTFLDPACGVGNFLVETFNQLKKLENDCLKFIENKEELSHVSIDQFYGIEKNPAITLVAKTALLIADLENDHLNFNYENNNLITANALDYNWNDLILNLDLNFIIGNPPFLGARVMNKEQKEDLKRIFGKEWKNAGDLDYVSAWFKKSYDYMKETSIKAAFVATSSICEGLSVVSLFEPLIKEGFTINFAWQSFKWNQDKAAVYVVIIGFSSQDSSRPKIIFSENKQYEVEHINGYLIDGPEVYTTRRTKPLCSVPEMGIGNKPVDGGNYLFKESDYKRFIKEEPKSEPFFRPFYGAKEFVNRKPRYCLYLGNVDKKEYQDLDLVMDRVEKVKNFRLASKSEGTRKIAETPTRFHVENIPDSNYLAIPRVSSPNRDYIPIGFMDKNVLASDALLIIPDTDLYHFGVLTSKLHMVWLNFVCGRFGKALRYSNHIVYNNFPWPESTESERQIIEKTAKEILKVREKYEGENFNKLYNPKTMPKDLIKAHQDNDKAVIRAYHFKNIDINNKSKLISLLFERYSQLIKEKG